MEPSDKTTSNSKESPPVFTENEQGELVPAGSGRPPSATIPLPPAPAGTAPAPPGSAPAPVPAADDDKIEKSWADRVRQIIGHTSDDPHKQSEELTILKADFMKKRYGKTIKTSQ